MMSRNHYVTFVLSVCLLCISSVSYANKVWDYDERQGWGDGSMPDGDVYGNSDVWRYQYVVKTDTTYNPSNYTNMPVWDDLWYGLYGWTAQDPTIWCLVRQDNYMHADWMNSSIILFTVQEEGFYDVYINVYSNTDGNGDGYADGHYITFQHNSNADTRFNNPLGVQVYEQNNYWLDQGDIIAIRLDSYELTNHDSIVVSEFTLEKIEPEVVPEPLSIFLLACGLSLLRLKRK